MKSEPILYMCTKCGNKLETDSVLNKIFTETNKIFIVPCKVCLERVSSEITKRIQESRTDLIKFDSIGCD